ncbi:ABC-type dipeptide/oligopeptide/nickel transport system, permease component [Methanocella conradii HZ254]|uniref:ABC-type dipeptide/oligopeptide/nickel transport system, permease component n=1 Tax=Methanocella conradii (strain DSM 24694 / JCM 17849 / CGMCC 1.5162 / HZ254) TaxID=1041930 RepID=H8IAP9_METCZ|nr:ABC transporter permease [Methanocella conradii]AFD00554.1 ABC-type dipeptide/oligopeptide/nickel transport system, permease component [Methanocella conradii HZ254]MDI6896249.1 ABC transporter permease [Methanocella conradii]
MSWNDVKFNYLTGKLLRYGFTLFIILSINFFIPRAMPGDPMVNLLGEDALHVDEQILDALRAEYGLDRPLHEQYLEYMFGIIQLDFGYSIHKNLKVADLIKDRLFWTLVLVFPSIIMGGILALVFGSIAGFRHGGNVDKLLTSLNIFLYTLPSFLFAMVIVSIFSFHLGWFPLGNLSSGKLEGLPYLLDVGWHLFLPVAILSIHEATYIFLVVRNSITQIMGEYFVFVAKAKGLPERIIELRHVLRNVLPQFISIMALNFGFMVSGALIIEVVFSLNGMGTLIYDAVMARDYPVMQGCFVVLTIFVVAANFVADLLYGIADPRIADAKNIGASA